MKRRQDLADEFADIVTDLDILAMRAGVDLGEATRSKFNMVRLPRRIGCVYLILANCCIHHVRAFSRLASCIGIKPPYGRIWLGFDSGFLKIENYFFKNNWFGL